MIPLCRKVCKILLIIGADINGKDSKNRTPLICAAASGCVKTSKALVRRNANIEDASSDGDTALLYAIRSHNNEVVELLMDNKANVTHRNLSGLGVIETALKWDAKDSVNVICSHERYMHIYIFNFILGHLIVKALRATILSVYFYTVTCHPL